MNQITSINSATIIGAGCVGNFLAEEFYKAGIKINEIVSNDFDAADEIAQKVGASVHVADYLSINQNSDLYILSVKDEKLLELRKSVKLKDQIVVHTSGSVGSEVLKNISGNYGVFYPLQSIIRERKPDASKIPFFITANNDETACLLEKLARQLSDKVTVIADEIRQKIHLAAVFTSNFTNYLLKISAEIAGEEDIDFEYFRPLAEETVAKAFEIGPLKAQTGPAKRGDCWVTDKHVSMLKNPSERKLYKLFTDMIREEYKTSATKNRRRKPNS